MKLFSKNITTAIDDPAVGSARCSLQTFGGPDFGEPSRALRITE
jgi:hypothetical protein